MSGQDMMNDVPACHITSELSWQYEYNLVDKSLVLLGLYVIIFIKNH